MFCLIFIDTDQKVQFFLSFLNFNKKKQSADDIYHSEQFATIRKFNSRTIANKKLTPHYESLNFVADTL